MAKIADVQEVSIETLRPYARNAKKHGAGQIEKLKASIREFGFLTPCLIDGDYNLIAGHGRVMAAKELGIEKVPCVFIDGLTEDQRKAYILADNRLGELGEWDAEMVSSELEDLRAAGFEIDLTGFSIDDIIITDDLGADLSETEMAEMEESAPSRVQRGDIWMLGRHRLLCGDSTKAEDVKRLMAGRLADLLETDPPYGVSLGMNGIEVENSAVARARHRRANGLAIENDGLQGAELMNFLVAAFTNARNALKPGASFYIWHADNNGLIFRMAAAEAGLTIHQVLVWVKNSFTLGRSDYQWKHEPCLYGWKDGSRHYFIDARTLTTVNDYDTIQTKTREELIEWVKDLLTRLTTVARENKPQRSELHPTMKPVSMIEKQIRNSTKEGDLVLDLFGGSGTTLIAAEEINRTCYMVEYDPHYCDVILSRWEALTGGKAERQEVTGNE